ncbi:hypothetical protein J6590_085336 [Homalodisca vitripennis]|nr:hypothetical protein J6590_085336 [Homalodisca vitripennis]
MAPKDTQTSINVSLPHHSYCELRTEIDRKRSKPYLMKRYRYCALGGEDESECGGYRGVWEERLSCDSKISYCAALDVRC